MPAQAPDTIIIRPATPDDHAGIADTHSASVRALAPGFYGVDIIAHWARPREAAHYRQAADKGEVFFVATDPANCSRVLGFSSYLEKDNRHCLQALYVRGDAVRRGIGRRLLAAVEDHARGRQARHLHTEGSLSGEAFYQAGGFIETGRREKRFGDEGDMVTVLVIDMVKALNDH